MHIKLLKILLEIRLQLLYFVSMTIKYKVYIRYLITGETDVVSKLLWTKTLKSTFLKIQIKMMMCDLISPCLTL